MPGVELADAHQLLSEYRALVAGTWEFFVTVHLGLFAALILAPPRPGQRRPQLALLIPFYLGFMFVNYRAQLDNYFQAQRLLNYIRELEANLADTARLLDPGFQPTWVVEWLPVLYIGASAFSSLLIAWFAVAPARRPRELVS